MRNNRSLYFSKPKYYLGKDIDVIDFIIGRTTIKIKIKEVYNRYITRNQISSINIFIRDILIFSSQLITPPSKYKKIKDKNRIRIICIN